MICRIDGSTEAIGPAARLTVAAIMEQSRRIR
jgi:hypothetical protein